MRRASAQVKLAAVVQVMNVGACEVIPGDNIENFDMEEAMRLSMHDDITAIDVEARTVSVTMEATTVSAANPKLDKKSLRSMRSSLGLAQPVAGVVLEAPITRVAQNPMHGLTVRVDTRGSAETQLLGAHRVLLLVQGTTKSSVERVNEKDDPDAFCVTSSNVKCLLDEGLGQEVHLELRGYCDMDTMLDFRLDMETAIVMVSSLESEGGRCAAAVEWVRKIEPHNLGQMRALLDIEWKTALTDLGADVLDSHMSPARPEYWESDGQPPARKIRRVDSDPQSPTR